MLYFMRVTDVVLVGDQRPRGEPSLYKDRYFVLECHLPDSIRGRNRSAARIVELGQAREGHPDANHCRVSR